MVIRSHHLGSFGGQPSLRAMAARHILVRVGMIRFLAIAVISALLVSGCKVNDDEPADTTEAVLEFDGLCQDCFDASVRIRSRNSIGSASAVRYLKTVDSTVSTVDSPLDATHVEFETNRHVAGDQGDRHVIDVWYEGDLVSSVHCQTDDSWFESGISKDIATIVVSLESLGGAIPVVPAAPYGKADLKTGEKIFTVGCSDGRVPRARCGSILKVSNGLIFYLPKSISGDSGSAVFKYSSQRDAWEVVGRTAWAMQVDGKWIGLAMTSDRVADIRAGRVSAGNFGLPEGAVLLSAINSRLPDGAITCDQVKIANLQQEPELPKRLEINRQKRWRFPIRGEDIRQKPDRQIRARDWTILGGVVDFFKSLIRFALWVAILLAILSAWVAPTILTPLKYDWPIQFVKLIIAKLRNL
tara:strand:+ start:2461 stop:3699 length:1239 start_codon:yes stop_codon:yes gene_type:complete